MEREEKTSVVRIGYETQESRVTIDYRPRNVTMYYIQDQELETLGSASARSSLHLAFFGAAVGAAISLGATIFTVDIANLSTKAIFWALFVLSSALALYFGIRAVLDYRDAKGQIRSIREQSRNREMGSRS